ncbi:MAG: GNAT family N-acetyltransferase, partial [Bacteroidota bacterium]
MPVSAELRTDRLLLSHLTEADIPRIIQLANNPKISEVTLNIPHPYSEDSARFWLQMGVDGRKEGNRELFAIRNQEGLFLGGVGLDYDRRHRKGTLGYWIGEPYWGQGFMTEAVKAIIAFGFEELGLCRIEATHILSNPASGRVMAKAGMAYEVLRR